jgi:hypothetical protein
MEGGEKREMGLRCRRRKVLKRKKEGGDGVATITKDCDMVTQREKSINRKIRNSSGGNQGD